jgi:hypothetical protein
MKWKKNTSHNPSLELDEHQEPIACLPRLQVQNESSSSSHNDFSSYRNSYSEHNH